MECGSSSMLSLLFWTLIWFMGTMNTVKKRFCNIINNIVCSSNKCLQNVILFQLRTSSDGLLRSHTSGPALPTRRQCNIDEKQFGKFPHIPVICLTNFCVIIVLPCHTHSLSSRFMVLPKLLHRFFLLQYLVIIPKYWQDGVCDDETEVKTKFLPSVFLHLVLD